MDVNSIFKIEFLHHINRIGACYIKILGKDYGLCFKGIELNHYTKLFHISMIYLYEVCFLSTLLNHQDVVCVFSF